VKFSAYAPSKPSDVEWLGNVPQDWTVKSIKRETPVLRGASPRPIDDPKYFDDDGDFAWVRISDVTSAGKYLRKTEQRLSDIGSALSVKLEPGALFLSIAGSVGKPCITAIRCCIHDGFVYFPRWKGDVRFLYYIFASGEPYRGLGKLGTQLNLNTDTVGAINIAMPAANEQRTIADFLDRETARLDTLAGKKRELIEKLKEKRTALISRTVTRGLPAEAAAKAGRNPHPKFKSSGIEWLGDIPEHWNAKRLKRAAVVTTGFAFSSDDFTADGVPVLRIGDIDQEGQVSLVESKFLPVDYLRRHSNVLVRKGDIVMAMTGATIGKVGRYVENTPALLNQRVCIFRAVETSEQAFLWYLLNSEFYIEHVVLTAFGGAQPNISDTELLSCPVPLPDKPEQRAIANYLDRETAKIDKMMEKVEAAIEKLQEYRTALITAAVTGKIDVRAVDR
jgi:type I restriction enzyme S subunit